MPFDTTYHIKTYNPDVNGKVTIPGEGELTLFLAPWQLPSQFDSLLVRHDSIVYSTHQMLAKESESAKTYKPDYAILYVFLAFIAFFLITKTTRFRTWVKKIESVFGIEEEPERIRKPKAYLTYYGDEINFTDAELAVILSKRFAYYRQLNLEHQSIFIHRVQKFMAEKTFKIHDEKAFKEMPVLISAAAIQLTFGLKKYLLPHFEFIHIHPQEFLRVHPVLCFLEGNVSGHAIRLSWKHFIDGYDNPNDGQNVGLHELAHALHYQTFIVERNVDRGFRNYYDGFSANGDKAYQSEKSKEQNLYSEYAEKNLQEFWAESVEIFFEKPKEMRGHYPQLYESMKSILNQDPINHIPKLSS